MMRVVKRVNYCNVCDTFKTWLSENGHRFNRTYKIRHYDKGESLRIYFEDVTLKIRCHVSNNISVYVQHQGEHWDYLEDFDCYIKCGRNHKYYCGYCFKQKHYNTPQELLIDHSFEKFLDWATKKFTPHHVLELTRCGGATSARILDTREPEYAHIVGRGALKEFLVGLRKVDGSIAFTSDDLDKTKIAIIPVIKGK